MTRKLHRPIKFPNLNCRWLEMVQTRENKDKGKRIQPREGVKMKTEEYDNLVLHCSSTDLTEKWLIHLGKAKNVVYLLLAVLSFYV